MALTSDGIEKVRVFELPCGVRTDGASVASPRLALVKWCSCWVDKLHQVYVNGRYAGTTIETDQNRMIVQAPSLLERPVRIEVFAVETDESDTDFSAEVDSPFAGGGRVKLSFLRSQELPAGSTLQIYFDNGSGQIDYDNPLNSRPIKVWPSWQDKAGFAMSRFGTCDFGWDSAAAVGFGKGSFGRGQFGLDAEVVEWISQPMRAGICKFAVGVIDKFGNETVSQAGTITVIPAARPAENLSVSSFDKQANQLVLSVS